MILERFRLDGKVAVVTGAGRGLGAASALALAEAHYARIQKEDGAIGAYLTLSKERALEQADRIDRMAAEGKPLPPLGGVPARAATVTTNVSRR